MSFYNLMNGVSPLALFLIPMLGDKHPDSYPRFRDVFTEDEEHPEYNDHIHVYTRVGGGNRGQGYGEEELYKHPNFVTSFDDAYDCTYASYVFSVPEKWKPDFELIKQGKFPETSEAYKKIVLDMFPKIKEPLTNILTPSPGNIRAKKRDETHQKTTSISRNKSRLRPERPGHRIRNTGIYRMPGIVSSFSGSGCKGA